MSNIPNTLKEALAAAYPLAALNIVDRQISTDGTRKYVLEYSDGTRVETLSIPSFEKNKNGLPKHISVCFSSQAGCAMSCAFCATGKQGLTRSLSSGEMLSQLIAVKQDFATRLGSLVCMGQGEPFCNYNAVLETLRFANSTDGHRVGARHITVSTCGIIRGVERFAQEPEQFTLAVSLHSARQEVRDALMPLCTKQPLPKLKEALLLYTRQTNRRISLEYLLIKDVNDTKEDLDALLFFCEGLLCHINIIPLNATNKSPFRPSLPSTQQHWIASLRKANKECSVRNSRGGDIDGACGQLKNKLS